MFVSAKLDRKAMTFLLGDCGNFGRNEEFGQSQE